MRGDTVAPRTMGDFLRDFEGENLKKLNRFLLVQAKSVKELNVDTSMKKTSGLIMSFSLPIQRARPTFS